MEPEERLNTFDPDRCCQKPLQKALETGKLTNTDTWECPKCGETWKAEDHGPVRHWRCVPFVAVFR